jgi:hypothetical protein
VTDLADYWLANANNLPSRVLRRQAARDQLSINWRSVPPPAFNSSIADFKRKALVGDDRRCIVSSIACQSASETITTDSAFCREMTTGSWFSTTRSMTSFKRSRVGIADHIHRYDMYRKLYNCQMSSLLLLLGEEQQCSGV